MTIAIRITDLPYKVKNTLWFWQISIDVNVPNIPQRCWVYRSDVDFLHCFEFLHSQSKRLCFHVFSPFLRLFAGKAFLFITSHFQYPAKPS